MAEYSIMTYGGQTVKIAKVKKENIRGSVDGNKYGTSYDKTIPSGFSDKSLINDGYTEAIAINGGIFYSWETDTYAEGIEISRGCNNQDFNMDCVSDFEEVMAVGFGYDGSVVFDRQKNFYANWWDFYGAVTFCFGIMKNGQKAEWGKSEHASQYNCVSGRTILGQDAEYIYALSIAGTTGTTGLRGSQLFALCQSLGMTDAGCFDGGGSVFMRVNGDYKNNTTRKIKNAVLIYEKNAPQDDSKPSQSDSNKVGTIECNVRFKVVHGSYGTPKVKVATRETATSKYDTSKPVYVGDIFTVTKMVSHGEYYIGYMADGTQATRWILLDPSDIVQID